MVWFILFGAGFDLTIKEAFDRASQIEKRVSDAAMVQQKQANNPVRLKDMLISKLE